MHAQNTAASAPPCLHGQTRWLSRWLQSSTRLPCRREACPHGTPAHLCRRVCMDKRGGLCRQHLCHVGVKHARTEHRCVCSAVPALSREVTSAITYLPCSMGERNTAHLRSRACITMGIRRAFCHKHICHAACAHKTPPHLRCCAYMRWFLVSTPLPRRRE